MGECFPIVTSWLWQARDRGAKLIVADPRQTPIARTADIFLPLRSGTDSALLNAMLHVVIQRGLVDEEFIRSARTAGTRRRRWSNSIRRSAWRRSAGCVPRRSSSGAAVWAGERGADLHARGLEHQSKGVDNGVAAVNLALATGNFGRPGAGYMTLTGQGNGQGGREMGQKASQLPGEREIEDPEDRAYISSVWGIDEKDLPHAGYPATLMIPAMLREEIRGLLHDLLEPDGLAARPAHGRTGVTRTRSLRRLDFFLSETCELADVVLPGNVWAEEEGTTTNLEGRVIKYNKAVDPPERRAPRLADCLRPGEAAGQGQYFTYKSPRDIFDELRLATKGSKADYFGITYEKIDLQNGVFWPCPTEESQGTPRLYEESFGFADGKAKFHPITYLPPAEEPDAEYPLVLTTGRVIYHYLSGNQTRRTPFLLEQAPYPWVEIHERTAAGWASVIVTGSRAHAPWRNDRSGAGGEVDPARYAFHSLPLRPYAGGKHSDQSGAGTDEQDS